MATQKNSKGTPSASRQKPGKRPVQPASRQGRQNTPPKRGQASPGKAPARPAGKAPDSRRRLTEAEKEIRRRQIQTSQKKKRRKYKHNYTIYYIMLALLLTAAGIALSLTVFFRVETIEITGSSYYTESQIRELLQVSPGDNLLRYNASAEKGNLMSALSRADQVTVKKKFPNTLLIEIVDGVPVMQLYNGGQYYYISGEGRILYSGVEPLMNLTVYLGLGADYTAGSYLSQCLPQETLDRLEEISSAIQKRIPGVITLVDLSSMVDVKLCYENRLQVEIGSFADLEEKLDMLRETMESGGVGQDETGVMDLNQSNMLVFNSAAEMDEAMALAGEWDAKHSTAE